MKKSEIKLVVELDKLNVPEKIFWEATDSPTGKMEETKAIAVSLWDPKNKNTMRLNLWAKDMPVEEMKQFYIEAIGGMGESLLQSTGDEKMSQEVHNLCRSLVKILEEQNKKG